MSEFNRYLDKKLIIGTRDLADLRIGGTFQINDVDAFLFALNEAFGINAVDSPNAVILTRR